jgi:hypothetical protein
MKKVTLKMPATTPHGFEILSGGKFIKGLSGASSRLDCFISANRYYYKHNLNSPQLVF